MAPISIQRVESRQDWQRFLSLPWSLYANDPAWVPPLLSQLRDQFNPRKNPYFQHADVACFLALRGETPVARITAQVCERAQAYHEVGTGHFGFFECEDSHETAETLLQTTQQWLKGKGMDRIMGPFSLSINDEVGLLVEGFQRSPAILMGHHQPYYQSLLESGGYRKEIDLYAYYQDISQPYAERIKRIVHWAAGDRDIVVRPIDAKNRDQELRQIFEVFKEAWADNWGYVPPTQAEVGCFLRSISPLLNRGLLTITEVKGELAGFMVVLPDVNELIKDLDGKLFPTGWIKVLWRLKYAACHTVRVPLMGIRKQYQRTRLGAAIALSMIDFSRHALLPRGVTHCEMSWILESNSPMRSILQASGAAADKIYRIYSKSI